MTISRICLLIVATTVLVHGQTLFFDFTYLDDDKLVLEEHAFLRDPASLPRAFQRDVFGTGSPAYRPLLTLSLMLDAAVGGKAALAYHASNVAIHALAALCVFLLLRGLGYTPGLSAWSGLIFAVHPLLTPAVAWIPGRNDSLLGLWVLSSCLGFVVYVRTQKAWAYALHVVLFAAALFTKESALVVPLAGLLYLGLIARAPWGSRRMALLGIGWLVVVVTWSALRAYALISSRSASVSGRALGANARAILELLGAIVLPLDLRVYPTFSLPATLIGAVVALLLAAAVAVVVRPERRRYVLFGGLWFVFFLLPTLAARETTMDYDYLAHRPSLPIWMRQCPP